MSLVVCRYTQRTAVSEATSSQLEVGPSIVLTLCAPSELTALKKIILTKSG